MLKINQSKKNIFLKEDRTTQKSGWFDYIEGYSKKIYPIYINPSSKDYIRMKKENGTNIVRYIIDFKKLNLYVFDSDVLHTDLLYDKKIGKKILGSFFRKYVRNEPKTADFFYVGEKKIHLPNRKNFCLGESLVIKGKIQAAPGVLVVLSKMKINENLYAFLNKYFINIPNFDKYNEEQKEKMREEWIKCLYDYEYMVLKKKVPFFVHYY